MKKAIVGLALATFVAIGASAQDQSMSLADRPKGHHHRADMMQ